jgi:hypothetical protein
LPVAENPMRMTARRRAAEVLAIANEERERRPA